MKPAFWIWLLAPPVLTGMFITVLLMMPSLAPTLGRWIVLSAAASAVLAVPLSLVVGKALQ
jgi:hypothetical protein